MDPTMLISSKEFGSLQEVTNWANELIGRTVPSNTAFAVKKIVQFQVISSEDAYSAVMLVEIEKKSSMSSMVLSMRKDLGLSKEEDA